MLLLRHCSACRSQFLSNERLCESSLKIFTSLRNLSTSVRRTRQASYYDDLKLSPGASSEEIKSAFYKLSRTCHPDMNRDDPQALAKFQNLSEAYNTLSNPSLRTKYDKGVLGRSSSVAERERASHRYEGENFYQARSGVRSRDPRNLDNWVVQNRSDSFAHHQFQKKLKLAKDKRNWSNPAALGGSGGSVNPKQGSPSIGSKLTLYVAIFLGFIILLKFV
jgi:curved DNA-binding protein CbpA